MTEAEFAKFRDNLIQWRSGVEELLGRHTERFDALLTWIEKVETRLERLEELNRDAE